MVRPALRIDVRLLDQKMLETIRGLQNEGRDVIRYVDLQERVGCSYNTVGNSIKRLRNGGHLDATRENGSSPHRFVILEEDEA